MPIQDPQVAETRILQYFWDNWKTLSNPLEEYWDNKTNPEDGDQTPPNEGYVKPMVRPNEAPQTAFGDDKRRFTNTGLFTVEIRVPFGEGTSNANSYAGFLVNLFRSRDAYLEGGIWFRNPRHKTVGREGNYWHVNFIVEYEYDSVV